MTCPYQSYVSDLEAILGTATKTGAKVLIGSAGGAGSNAQVDTFIEIIETLCKKHAYSFKVVSIYSDIPKEYVIREIDAGHISPCGPVPELTAAEANAATNIVAQMGAEPYLTALKDGADIIIGG